MVMSASDGLMVFAPAALSIDKLRSPVLPWSFVTGPAQLARMITKVHAINRSRPILFMFPFFVFQSNEGNYTPAHPGAQETVSANASKCPPLSSRRGACVALGGASGPTCLNDREGGSA